MKCFFFSHQRVAMSTKFYVLSLMAVMFVVFSCLMVEIFEVEVEIERKLCSIDFYFFDAGERLWVEE